MEFIIISAVFLLQISSILLFFLYPTMKHHKHINRYKGKEYNDAVKKSETIIERLCKSIFEKYKGLNDRMKLDQIILEELKNLDSASKKVLERTGQNEMLFKRQMKFVLLFVLFIEESY